MFLGGIFATAPHKHRARALDVTMSNRHFGAGVVETNHNRALIGTQQHTLQAAAAVDGVMQAHRHHLVEFAQKMGRSAQRALEARA